MKKKKKLILHPKNPINLTESIELETSFECIFTNEIESKWKVGVKPQHSNIVALNLIKKISETVTWYDITSSIPSITASMKSIYIP